MIAKLNVKKCPFRKYETTETFIWEGNTPFPQTKSEDFMDCIDKECMAWGEKERTCLLMRKEEK